MKEIAIKMPDEMYDWFVNGFPDKVDLDELQRLVICGTILPKGHGKIIDADKIEWYGCMTEEDCPHKKRECKNCEKAECFKTQVDAIQAIIEADKENRV